MSAVWRQVSLKEVTSVLGDGLHGTPAYDPHGDHFFINGNNLSNGKITFNDTTKRVSAVEAAKHRKNLTNRTILVSINGTLGNVAFYAGEKVVLGKSACYFNVVDSVDKNFIRYVLDSEIFQGYIQNLATGSTIKNVSLKLMRDFQFSLPPVALQQRISGILAALDDRITLLRETNATLEAIAQALFKSWFVDFDPVRAKLEGRAPEGMDEATARLFPDSFEESELGLVPRGWRVMPIGDAVEAVGGATPDTKNPAYWEPAIHCWTTPKDLSGIAAPVLLDTERKLSDQGLAKIGSGALPVGTLLLSSRAPIGYLALAQVPLAINQGYIAMLPGGLLPPLYMLFWCCQNMENIKGRANGSTFMEISKKAFRPIPALVPSPETVQAFTAVAGTLFDRLIENEKQAQTLATLRDTLLPRLISGQLRLPEAQAAAEEALA
jgi:type I restriction enzyme S subunit